MPTQKGEKLVPVKNVGEIQVSLIPSTGMFTANVDGLDIERKSLEEIESAIKRMSSGTKAIFIGRVPRAVVITGRVQGKGLRLMDSSYINPAKLYAFDGDLLEGITDLQAKREAAIEAYRAAEDAFKTGMESLLNDAEELDIASIKDVTPAATTDAENEAIDNSEDAE